MFISTCVDKGLRLRVLAAPGACNRKVLDAGGARGEAELLGPPGEVRQARLVEGDGLWVQQPGVWILSAPAVQRAHAQQGERRTRPASGGRGAAGGRDGDS